MVNLSLIATELLRNLHFLHKLVSGPVMDTNVTASTSIWQNHCNGSPSSQSTSVQQATDMEPIPRKKTWSELKESVTELRKQLSRLSTMVPMNIQFRKLSDGRVRIYFLGAPPNGWETTLLCTDITPNMLSSESNDDLHNLRLHWQLLLEPSIPNLASNNSCVRAFQLLLERKRLSTFGITSYELHKKSGRMIFPASSSLFQCLDTGYNSSPLYPSELVQLRGALDPQICPDNSEVVAYISSGDIWVINMVSGHNIRLTNAHDENKSFSDNPLSAGVPSYVMQEEFSRYQGFWWQPNSDDGIFRILYEEVDESDVLLFKFPSSQPVGIDYEEYRFPRAGSPNAKSKLKLVQFELSETLQIENVCIKDLQHPLTYHIPWLEYIVRVGWMPDSQHIWAQLLNRQQNRLDLIVIPLKNFSDVCNSNSNSTETTSPNGSAIVEHSWQSSLTKQSAPIQVIWSQVASTWINVNDILEFIEVTDTQVTFIWASEETGFRHLYLVTSLLQQQQQQSESNQSKNGMVNSGDNMKQALWEPCIISKVALTSGEWEVLGRNLWYDRKKKLVYFLGLRETPLEKHLYVVSLSQPNHIRLLTKPGNSYAVEFNDECNIIVQTYCNIHQLPTCGVFEVCDTNDMQGEIVENIELRLLGYLFEGGIPSTVQLQKFSPSIYSRQLQSGEQIYAMVFKPHNYKPGQRYPTVVNVYGGPEVQTVNNTFKGMRQLRMHMLAAQGYCVVCIDSRGSRHRGVEFESHLWRRMGSVELADQVEILTRLVNDLGYIDIDRVAIHGWSYGGYLSLMGLIQYPSIFKLAIAGAPVTNWELYDTGYTERYMDLPEHNKEGYANGSVLSYINQFPDDDNRLLIIHGLIDENVHFYHTSELINLLIKANKPYQLQVYPRERHSLRNLEASKHYETTLLSFLQNNL
ncbi:dipeptidyl peptidase 9 isoform X2 [Contarinia nasturtii]|uniref:dipeptidyl peptidase 9 isoform X2 n=1 Tax=Contarinia nasturtii TaxID=265458 RepID=UPI0012D49300|nr:dipeptidyl peptidase 9 isoform X2 [Contarinia nasturtii]